MDDIQVLHQYVQRRLGEQGVCLDAIAICHHAPDDGCEYRKPRTGMARQVESQLAAPVACERSWVIGDKLSDLEFGRALGAQAALLRSRYWDEDQRQDVAALIANSLYDSSQAILARTRH